MESDSDSSVYDELDTSEEENGDLSYLGAAASTTVKVENVQRKSYQVIKKGSDMLSKQILESCQPPSGDLVPTSGSQGLDEQPSLPPRNGNTVIQYNSIQVQQQFGEVTVQGTRNLTIGGTQNVGGTGTSSEKEEKSPTWTERIMKRTVAKVKDWTVGMVKTSSLEKVMHRLNQGATWLTIKGSPGEGKSTVAFMALEELHKSGREVFQVISPEEFSEVISNSSQPVIVLDDIFGELEFDQTEWLRWKLVLHQVLDVLEHRSHERTTGNNKDRSVTVILVGRDYVLNAASSMMGRQSDFVMKDLYVVKMSLSTQRELEEKIKIWKAIVEPAGIQFSHKRVEQLCKIKSHHGFPHVCRLFVTIRKEDLKFHAEEFFKSPLDFLNLTIKSFFRDKLKLNLFREMIRCGGKISIIELEILDSELNTTQTAQDLVGTYLRQDGHYFRFDHPSIYDCVVYNFCKLCPLFVIQNCELSFILKRLQLQPLYDTQHDTVYSESGLAIHIPKHYMKEIAKRCSVEILNGKFMQVLSCKFCADKLFIDMMMSHIKVPILEFVCKVQYHNIYDNDDLFASDGKYDFIDLIVSNKSPNLLKYIADRTDILQNQDYTNRILFGICRHAALDALTYLRENSERFDINAQSESCGKTALMFAAESKDSEFVHRILTLHPDLTMKDKIGRTVFHYLCVNGLVSVAEQMLASGIDTDLKNNERWSTLWWACNNNQVEMIDFLLQRGASASFALLHSLTYLDTERVKELQKFGADLNMHDKEGKTPLHTAVANHLISLKIVNLLLKTGADKNAEDKYGNTPLHSAVKVISVLMKPLADTHLQRPMQEDKEDIISLLLKADADVNIQDKDGMTPLHTSVQTNNVKVMSMLLKADADVNVRDKEGSTPLETAVQRSDSNLISILLKAGADVNLQDTNGYSPLHTAIKQNIPEINVMLLNADADVNLQDKDGNTQLHTAMQTNKEDIISLLLKANADVNIQDKDGMTPLHTSMQTNNAIVIAMLLKADAEVNVQDNEGTTPLKTAVQRHDLNQMSMLMVAGADFNIQDTDGYTPLHHAAEKGYKNCIVLLLQPDTYKHVYVSLELNYCANVNVQTKDGCTPLHLTVCKGYLECLQVLLNAGANVNVQDNFGLTALSMAVLHGYQGCADLLLKSGADVNIQSRDGNAPLHRAGKISSVDFLHLLLKAGADINVQNMAGDTPLMTMAEIEAKDCVGLLLSAGADVNTADRLGQTLLHKIVDIRNQDHILTVQDLHECQELIGLGIHVNKQDKEGNTPLHLLCQAESLENDLHLFSGSSCQDVCRTLVTLLVDNGADVNIQNRNGELALHGCCKELLRRGKKKIKRNLSAMDSRTKSKCCVIC